jgi:hypothetical protein
MLVQSAPSTRVRRRPLLLEIVYRGVPRMDRLDITIAIHAERLASAIELDGCRVVIHAPSVEHGHVPFHIRIELASPRGYLVVSHVPDRDDGHTSPEMAIHDAFSCARRRMVELARLGRDEPRRPPRASAS